MKKVAVMVFALATVLGMTGCQSTEDETQAKAERIDVRQGEKVSQICFGRNIDGWRNLDRERDAVIVKKGMKEEYKVEFVGVCDARSAMMSIGTVSRVGSTCLTRGDKIVIPNGLMGADSCMITAIYEWDESKKVEEDENKSEDTSD